MKISPEQVDAVVEAGLVREAVSFVDADELHDAALDSLLNGAPVIVQWEAQQDIDFLVTIRGVPGAYFVQALESDDEGVYSNLAEAIAKAEQNYGEFFTGEVWKQTPD